MDLWRDYCAAGCLACVLSIVGGCSGAGPTRELPPAISRYDTNGDRKVTAANIAARIEKWQSSKVAIASLSVVLSLDGQPLADAKVTAEPESFLGAAVQPATGKSDAYGNAPLLVAGKPGASYGLYKIRVSKLVAGKETLPARYNASTELGLEFAPDSPELRAEGFAFRLKSK